MSNPAVIKLQNKRINNHHVWLDDNFGEAIHIHIDDIRIDLTTSEFKQLNIDIADSITNLINIEHFDCRKIDPVYFEVMLHQNILHLKAIKEDNVFLADLWAPAGYEYGILPLAESRAVKALNGDTKQNDGYRSSHHIGQNSQERLDLMYQSILDNGYPYNNQYIILYNDDYVIQDGQHRASCIYQQKGNIKVPVLRFYFDNYESITHPETMKPITYKIIRIMDAFKKMKNPAYTMKKVKEKLKGFVRKSKKMMKDYKRNKLERIDAEELKESLSILDNR